MEKTLRVATWNIGSLYSDYSRNLAYIQTLLSHQQADILCMQEVPKQEALLQDICRWGGFSHRVFHTTSISHVCQGTDMGIAVFSRFPMGAPEILKLTKPAVAVSYKGRPEVWHDKYFLAVCCDLGSQQALVVTGHGFPFHRYDLENPENDHIIRPSFRELDAWFSCLPARFGMPVTCAAADFNMTDPMPFLEIGSKQYRDLFCGEVTRPFGRKTDCILVRDGTCVAEKINITPPEENGEEWMDHHFILAALQI